MHRLDSFTDVGEDIINSEMSVEEIIRTLAKRNCVDITSSIDLSACSEYPCAGGGFCDVYQGMKYDGTRIAIKSLRVYDGPEAESQKRKILKRAARELYFWSRLRHRNVLPLIGLMLYRGRISMVSEWMENGNLMLFLLHHPNVDRVCLCMDICSGLDYIHDNGMVHGDLKAANVVVSSKGVAMITDFGNARLKDLTLKFSNTTSNSISVRWTAPELLQGTSSDVSKEADVYAYGITSLEVLSGETPYKHLNDIQVLHLVALEKRCPPRPDIDLDNKLWDVLTSCWSRNPTERPTITRISQRLQDMHPDCKSHPQQSASGRRLSNVSDVKNNVPIQAHTQSTPDGQEEHTDSPSVFKDSNQASNPRANETASNAGDLGRIAAPEPGPSQPRDQPNRANALNSLSGERRMESSVSPTFQSGLEEITSQNVSISGLGAQTSMSGLDWVPRLTIREGLGEIYDNHAEERMRLLSDLDRLDHEVYEGLITSLNIPWSTSTRVPSRKEVLFPANLISLILKDMWRYGMIGESERFLGSTMQAIETHVMSFVGEDAIVPGVFWLSNVHEILSFVCCVEDGLVQDMDDAPDFGLGTYDGSIQIIRSDLDSLECDIYHAWMGETKKRLSRMIIPALIETQSLPGFISEGPGRMFNRLLNRTTPASGMDDLVGLLNKVLKSLKCFFMEKSVIQRVVTELLKLVGVTSFNDLLMRRFFCSWKRAMQIDYNATRIKEWCESHEMPEGALQLEHLMQATKLLQLKKATPADINTIYDVCWILTPSQVQRMFTIYHALESETPISPEILKLVAQRVQPNDRTDHLLLKPESEDVAPYELPQSRMVSGQEHYVPTYLNIPHIRRLAAISP